MDNWDEDVISTNRQSLNWDLDDTKELRDFLQATLSQVQRDWREKRAEEKRRKITEKLKINVTEWYEKLPETIKPNVESIVDLIEKSELTIDDQSSTVEKLHQLIPEYPYYHWRNLHEEIKAICYEYYENKDYYTAFHEAVKKYSNATRRKSGIDHSQERSDYSLMAKAFHKDTGKLYVTANYLRPTGEEFSTNILEDIQNGQFQFSQGVIAGGRNPVAHEEIDHLRESDLFSEKDCLDLLSLLSHLFKRLDNAEKRT